MLNEQTNKQTNKQFSEFVRDADGHKILGLSHVNSKRHPAKCRFFKHILSITNSGGPSSQSQITAEPW